MIRPLLRSVRHLLKAVCLLVGVLCIGEVALRADRVVAARQRATTQPEIIVPSAVCHAELKPLLDLTRGERTLRSSSYGTRGAEPSVPKPAGTLRLLVLGDDSTLALDQPAAATFCQQIQTRLAAQTGQTVEVINAGLPGGCPLLSALQYRHRLAALRPDAVLLVLDAGDVVDDLRVRSQLRVDADGRPMACPHPATRSSRATWQSELILADLLTRQVAARWMAATSPMRSDRLCPKRRHEWMTDPDGWAAPLVDTLEPIPGLRDEAVAAGATFHLTAVPVADSLRPSAVSPWSLIGRFAMAHQLDWLDPTPGLARQSQAAAIFETADGCDVPKLSATGHALLGQAIALHLLRR